jgi:hypothetical protein
MSHSPNLYPIQRTPRVKLAGSVLALVLPENRRQVRARLHQLSFNGGLLQMTEPLDAELKAELVFHLGTTTVRTHVGTMSPMWATEGCLQPFRFTGLTEEDRCKMVTDLRRLLGIPDDPETLEARATTIEAPATLSPSGVEQAEAGPPAWIAPKSNWEAAAEATDETPLVSEVVLYFDSPEDALRFTMAASSVLSSDIRGCPSGELAKLFREFAKVSRVRTTGALHSGAFPEVDPTPAPLRHLH